MPYGCVLGAGLTKLALAVGEESTLVDGSAVLKLDGRAGEALLKVRRSPVMAYRIDEPFVTFVGYGRVMSVAFDADGAPSGCRLQPFTRFEVPVISQPETKMPGVRRMLRLEDARYDEIVTQGIDRNAVRMAAEEMSARYEESRAKLDQVYQRLYAQVLRRWDYHCSITGEAFAPVTGLHPSLQLVAIRPREADGPLHIDNYLPMTALAARAWTGGHLSMGADLGFLVDKGRIEPELEERLPRSGKWQAPFDGAAPPDELHLAFHRTHIFGR